MGNLPQSNFGNIYLRTNNAFYYAGDNITGEIYLNLLENFPGESIFLKIKGKEECEFEEQHTRFEDNPDGTRSSHTETIHHKGHNTFFRHKFPVYKWNIENIAPGQYGFPFYLVLGAQLPGTFYEKEHHYSARIKYKVKVELSPTHHRKHDVKPLKYTQELIVREPIKNQMMFNVPVENSINSKTWCCIDQGLSKIKCFFEKNTYCPNEIANMMCEVDNSQCNLNVKSVNMRLLMNIRLKASHGKEKFISETVNSYNMEGILAHETALDQKTKVAGILLTNQVRNRALQPSTSGSLVKCEYVLSVKTLLDGVTCCTADPEARIPLTIFAPPLINFNQVQAPENWNPSMMPAYNCVFNEGYAYPSEKDTLNNMNQYPSQQNSGMNAPMNIAGPPNNHLI